MNKKLLIPILLSGVLLPSLTFKNTFKVISANETISFDADAIQALSHSEGMTVSFVNDDIAKYWDSDASDIENLKSLYEVNDEISSFAANASNHTYTRNLYAKWDDFKPVNNTLTWKSNIKADTYDIVVSLNAEMTEALYEAEGLTEASYTMSNPFANTHYFWQVTAHKGKEVIKSTIFDFYSADYKRTIDIPGISNTRDIGGFTGLYGTMKQGLIYRSGRLDDINDDCKEALKQLDIQTDLDLRNPGEGEKNPAKLNNYYLKTLLSYFQDFTEERRKDTVEAVRVFANPDNYPVMFHCAVGRDRTGTLSILLQALAGASKEYIIHEYYTSMWSVTGNYPKSSEDLNLSIVNTTLEALESYGDSINTGAENFLKVKNKVGLTDKEIQAIRDIWSGKTETKHGQKTFKAKNNYAGKVFVKIESLGQKDISIMVDKGAVISAPYELNESLAWFSNGQSFDFTKPINETTYIYADYVVQYVVTIHFVGFARQDEILRLNSGYVLSLDKYVLDNYNMTAISDEGVLISELTITRDAYINIIYIRK